MPEKPNTPKVLFGTPKALLPISTEPKVIADGVLRERIRCTVMELSALDPRANSATVARALQLVNMLNLDDAHFDDVVRFGGELQAEHGAITEIELAIANHKSIQEAQVIFSEVLALFESLNPDVLFKVRKPSLIQVLRQWFTRKTVADIVFSENYARLLNRIDELKVHESALTEAASRLAALKPRYQVLAERIASAILAANFIVDKFRKEPVTGSLQSHYTSQIDALEQRATSLLSTRATLEMGLLTHAVLSQNLHALANTSNGMLEENLPAFNTAYTAALTSRQPSGSKLTALKGMYKKMFVLLKERKHE
ncbi:MAG: hypothetical protein ABI644_10415 [Arenimonas sp.]